MTREWLRNYRKTKNMTHSEVAMKVGIKRQYYGMIEGGKSNPSVDVAKSIANILEFEWTLFFEDKSNETLPTDASIA